MKNRKRRRLKNKIKWLKKHNGMSHQEAIEFHNQNKPKTLNGKQRKLFKKGLLDLQIIFQAA